MNATNEQSNQSNVAIEAIDFAPSNARESGRTLRLWHYLVAGFLLLAAFVFWFLFTSKSVQIELNPSAERIEISGGLVFELGGVYLLREGTYQLAATTELHEPLLAELQIGASRNQSVQLDFIPLPGTLTLALNPADATVKIDGVAVTATEAISLSAGEHDLLVEHPRYQDQRQTITIEGKKIQQRVDIALAPNWAEVTVDSTPLGAEIWIDGEATGVQTPGIVQALAGEREISIRSTGYKTHRERIFAQAGVDMALAPVTLVQADAQLNITTSPSGAGVTVNGVFMGQTPTQLDLKSGQPHVVAIIKNGYDTFTQRVRLARGEVEKLHTNLRLQTGEVVIRTEPETAALSVDGKSRGSANQVLTLPIRAHEIAISLPGYAGFRQTIVPKVGLKQEVKVKLLTLAEARLAALKPSLRTAAGQSLKLFEPFAFSMGASRREPGRRANETLRKVDMSRLFYLATHEVTNDQFRAFAAGHDSGSFVEISLNEGDMPVTSVSWEEAAAYCNWLSDQDKLPHFYQMEFGKVVGVNANATGYRLPTEAEWAWAARTSTIAADTTQLRFPWGANLPPPDRQGNYADRAASALVGRVIFGYNDNHTAAAPIGTFKADRRGLYDMGGNVSEWINDFYEIPGQAPVKDPLGPASGEYHVIRGSSWMHGTITELRYSFRDYGVSGRQDLGFRIARFAE